MLRLHYAPRTISVAVAIALEAVKADHELVRVDFSKFEQTQPAYLQINPKGRVPALETPQGILTEAPAIIQFVAPDLIPDDPYAAAKMRELIAYLNGTMHPHHAHAFRGIRWADEQSSFDDMKQKVPRMMAECCAYLEQLLPTLPFDVGALDVLSDAYLYVVLTWLAGDGVEIENYPKLAAFQHRMHSHAAVQAVYEKGML